MYCPLDGTTLVVTSRRDVEIDDCPEPIPLERLDALPSVAHCVRCAVGARRMR
jgi:hypothetical protein